MRILCARRGLCGMMRSVGSVAQLCDDACAMAVSIYVLRAEMVQMSYD